MNNGFVLRLKNEKRGHIFYEGMSDGYVDTVKMKHATEYKTKDEAQKTINQYNLSDFDIVPYKQAERDYYE